MRCEGSSDQEARVQHTAQPHGGYTLFDETPECFMVADTVTRHLRQATLNHL